MCIMLYSSISELPASDCYPNTGLRPCFPPVSVCQQMPLWLIWQVECHMECFTSKYIVFLSEAGIIYIFNLSVAVCPWTLV